MKMWFAILLVVFSDSFGNLAIRQGMRQVGDVLEQPPCQTLEFIRRVIKNKMLRLGILCMTVSFFSFLTLLSWANLSFVLPITSLGYVINTLGAKLILKEDVTLGRWMGTLFVCAGVALVSL